MILLFAYGLLGLTVICPVSGRSPWYFAHLLRLVWLEHDGQTRP